jgi:glycosyltransferase involved in cell wall biosynthesis
VLNLSPIPPSPRRGGSQIQMLDRLKHERDLRPVAMAYPKDAKLLVELRTQGRSGRFSLDLGAGASEAITEAARLLDATTIHFESLHGFSFNLVESLSARGHRVVLSLHDFTLFCRRPHLIDSTTNTFCEYSTDPDRCRKCLGLNNEDRSSQTQEEYRLAAARALCCTIAVIYPSRFLRGTYQDLFPSTLHRLNENVIAPATSSRSSATSRKPDASTIGFVGGLYSHKGGTLIPSIMEETAATVPQVTAFAYGSGEDSLARAVRRTGAVRVRGYYRDGSLPALLARDRVGIAVLPSIWPEAYGIVVDECLASGVPVIAFDLGAVGERLREWKTGSLVPFSKGPGGLARAIIDHVSSPSGVADSIADRIPHPADAARQHVALYHRLKST